MIYLYIVGAIVVWFGAGLLGAGFCYATTVKRYPEQGLTEKDFRIFRLTFCTGIFGLLATILSLWILGAYSGWMMPRRPGLRDEEIVE